MRPVRWAAGVKAVEALQRSLPTRRADRDAAARKVAALLAELETAVGALQAIETAWTCASTIPNRTFSGGLPADRHVHAVVDAATLSRRFGFVRNARSVTFE